MVCIRNNCIKNYIFFLCLATILFNCGKSEGKNIEAQKGVSKEYELSLCNVTIKFSDLVIEKTIIGKNNFKKIKYKVNSDKEIKILIELLDTLQLKVTSDALKLLPEESYYISFNSRKHLFIMDGKHLGKYHGYLLNKNNDAETYINFTSRIDIANKIKDFLE